MKGIAMRDASVAVIALLAATASFGVYLAKGDDDYCPQPSAASVATLFAPCQAFDAAMGRSITKQEAAQMGLLRSDKPPAATRARQPAPTPAQLVADDFQTMAQEHATVGMANSKREH